MRLVTCFHCATEFDRGYRISARRGARPQFCSVECRAMEFRLTSENGFEEKFWSMTETNSNGCIHWLGRLNKAGYGIVDRRHLPQLAHRVAFSLATGRDPGAHKVCHSCDNPRCVNPAHLWLGTQADNVRDMMAKGRNGQVTRRGMASNKCKLFEWQVLYIVHSTDSDRVLGEIFNVTASAIYNIRNGKAWAHLTGINKA